MRLQLRMASGAPRHAVQPLLQRAGRQSPADTIIRASRSCFVKSTHLSARAAQASASPLPAVTSPAQTDAPSTLTGNSDSYWDNFLESTTKAFLIKRDGADNRAGVSPVFHVRPSCYVYSTI